MFAQGGAKTAHEVFLPALNAGHYGFTEREIRARMDQDIRAAVTPKGPGEAAWSADERFMWRLGFESVALPSIEHAMDQARAGAAEVIRAIASVVPLHSRAGRRPLRPEDFGTLPGARV